MSAAPSTLKDFEIIHQLPAQHILFFFLFSRTLSHFLLVHTNVHEKMFFFSFLFFF